MAQERADEEDEMPIENKFDLQGEAWQLLVKKANDETLSSDELRKYILELCKEQQDQIAKEPLVELSEEEREALKKPLGPTKKRTSDKAFNSTMKELQRLKGDVPPSGPWKPSIRPRLVHLDPNRNKKRRVVFGESRTAEADDQETPGSSTSEEQPPPRVFGPSDREAAKQKWVAKMKAGQAPFTKKEGTYSSGSGETPYSPASPGSS